MPSALDDLAKLEKMLLKPRAKRGSMRVLESRKTTRALATVTLESLADDLGDKAAMMTVLKMVESVGINLTKPLHEAIRNGDEDMVNVIRGFTDKIRLAVAKATEETIDELSK
jgi:hypothetical protein